MHALAKICGIEPRIVRFQNIFGLLGSYDGHEKASSPQYAAK
jgi:hypothetical protein